MNNQKHDHPARAVPAKKQIGRKSRRAQANAFRSALTGRAEDILIHLCQWRNERGEDRCQKEPSVRVTSPGEGELPLACPYGRGDSRTYVLTDQMTRTLSRLPAGPPIWRFVKIYLEELSAIERASSWAAVRDLATIINDVIMDRMKMPGRRFPGEVDYAGISIALALPIGILGLDWVWSFLSLRFKQARGEHAPQRTANQILNSARSIFSEKRRNEFRLKRLKLPASLDDFLEAKSIAVPKVRPVAPSVEILERVLTEMAALQGHEQGTYIFLALSIFGGLRKAEALHARRWWLISSLQRPVLQIRREMDFVPKSRRGRRAIVPQWVFRRLKRLTLGRKFLVAQSRAERMLAYKRAKRFLRHHGITNNHPVHHMRAFYASALAFDDSINVARKSLGHASMDTTQIYLLKGFSKEHLKIWEKKR